MCALSFINRLLLSFTSSFSQLRHAARADLHAEGAVLGDAPSFTSSLDRDLFHSLFRNLHFSPRSNPSPLLFLGPNAQKL